MKRHLLIILATWALGALHAQVTTSPSPIKQADLNGQIVITFDPAAGNAGMKNATQCYCHTGLITAASANDADWKNVTSSWRSASEPQLQKTNDGKWQLVIDNVYTFYSVAETTEIVKLAFVFHDGPGGSKEGKTASGGDIFVEIADVSTQLGIWRDFEPQPCVDKARPDGIDNGIYYGEDGTSVTLCTYAASKTQPANHVFLVGDFTNWKLSNDFQLYRDGNYFWITLKDLTPGQEYCFQYAVERADGKHVQISDLFSEKVLHPNDQYEPKNADPTLRTYPAEGADGGYVTVIQPGKEAYQWADSSFVKPDKNNLIIYELWTYDFTPERNLAGVMKRLDYIKNLGVNAVELMPVCEFDGNYNWGYSPNHYFALDKAYGTPLQLKQFVDSCHANGIAVILDMVFNHATGLNPMNKLYPYGSDLSQNPWFNVSAPHSDNVYEDWNHGFQPAHQMFVRALQYWIEEYHIDGYRMDLSHGFCSEQPNTSLENITDYYTRAVAPAGAYFILEHWGSNMATERPALVNLGCLCWNNTSNAYCQTAMGWLRDGDSFSSANQDGYVSYTCSHDEERPFYKALKYGNGDLKTNEEARIKRIAANLALNVLLDGPHMIWQFEEIGYDFSINSSIDNATISENNRCSKKPRPESAGYFRDSRRMAQWQVIAQVVQLRTRLLPQVFEGNPTACELASGKTVRTVQWGNNVWAAANFSPTDVQVISLPSGTWYNYLQGATSPISGGPTYTLQPGELMVFTGEKLQLPQLPSAFPDFNTSIDQPSTNNAAYKTIENGRIIIFYNGHRYDILGRKNR